MNKLLIATATACVAFAGVAGAASRVDSPSVVVKYDDLNLNSKAGVAKLHARIHGAALYVCSPLDSRVLGVRDAYDRCVTDAVAQAVNTVGNVDLINFHRNGAKASLVAKN